MWLELEYYIVLLCLHCMFNYLHLEDGTAHTKSAQWMINVLSALKQNESQGTFSGEMYSIFFRGQAYEMRTLWSRIFNTQNVTQNFSLENDFSFLQKDVSIPEKQNPVS